MKPPAQAFICPLCNRTFATERTLIEHIVKTTKHEGIIAYVARLRVLLEEAVRVVAIYRGMARGGVTLAWSRTFLDPILDPTRHN